jgi:hypothetical protein
MIYLYKFRYKIKIMFVTKGVNYLRRRYYFLVDKTLHYKKIRWSLTGTLVAIYFYRIDGLSYDVITYLIGFYLLQLFSSYLTPIGIP